MIGQIWELFRPFYCGTKATEFGDKDEKTLIFAVLTIFLSGLIGGAFFYNHSIPVQILNINGIIIYNYPKGETMNLLLVGAVLAFALCLLGALVFIVCPGPGMKQIHVNHGSAVLARWVAAMIIGISGSVVYAASRTPKPEIQAVGHSTSQYRFRSDDKEGRTIEFLVQIVKTGQEPGLKIPLRVALSKELQASFEVSAIRGYRGKRVPKNEADRKNMNRIGYSRVIDPDTRNLMSAKDEMQVHGYRSFFLYDKNMKEGNFYTIVFYIHPHKEDADLAILDEELKNTEGSPITLSLVP